MKIRKLKDRNGVVFTPAVSVDSVFQGKSSLTSLLSTVNTNITNASKTAEWGSVSGKPSTFTPSTHTHTITQVTNLQTTLDAKEVSSNKVKAWSTTTSDTNYPSEKLVKTSLDGKANSSHTHTIAQITSLQTTLDAKALNSDLTAHTGSTSNPHKVTAEQVGLGNVINVASYSKAETDTKLSAKLNTSLKGAASGLAELDATGKVPSSQLPSYVDDVLEYTAKSKFPTTGETGKIYVDTSTNLTYRWGGTAYVEISPSLALGETSSTAFPGDRGKTVETNLSNHTGNSTIHITSSERSTWNGKYTKPSSGISKTDLASSVQTSLGKADTALQAHQDISGKEDKSNKVTAWSSTTTNTNYPSEKLVKSSLDGKANSSHTHTKSQITDFPTLGTAASKGVDTTVTADSSNLITSGAVSTALSGKSSTSHTHSAATIYANGFMSSTDKSKLNGISEGADSVSFTRSLSSGTKVGTITINGTGTDLYAPTNTDTHYTAKNVVSSATDGTSNVTSATSNPYINLIENGSVRSSHRISGSGATTVKTDASGNLIISSTDTNTTSVTATTSGSGNAVTAVTASGSSITVTKGATFLTAHQDISGKENTSNKVTAWSSTTTDAHYPSEKLVKAALDGKAASSHTHTKSQITDFPSSMPASDVYSWAKASTKPSYSWSEITSKPSTFTPASHTQGEATLTWGGGNFSGTYGPIDASMVPELGANRLAFGRASGITVEYSRDGGSTWTDYGASNESKINLFSPPGSSFSIGKADSNNKATANYLLRVTINTGTFGVYTELNKFMIYCSTYGSSGSYCTIDAALESTPTTFVNFANKVSISGWSGYNIINTSSITTYGNSASNQYGRLRFTFGCTGGSNTYTGLGIIKIYGFGGVGWVEPSNLAKYGTIYSVGSGQSVSFPSTVSATGFSGNASSATKATQDSAGQTISTTYIKGLSVSGKTITYTKGDGNTGTITTQDTIYSSKTAASGGTDVSLVTTGEKYTWNNKANSSHTHGNITNAGAIGTAANKLITTTTNGVLTAATTLAATSLAAGATPTVSLSSGTLTFGIPKGPTGPTGPAAGFGTPTASVDANVGTPSVTVTASGADTAKVFNFAFKNLKGQKGDTGSQGPRGPQGPQGEIGPQGPTGPNFAVAVGSGNQYLLGVSSQTGIINTSKTSGAYYNGSNVYASGFYISSLRKWKENIKPTEVNAVDVINRQTIVDFNYKEDELKRHKVGLIADDSDKVFLDANGETVDLYNTCGILLKAVQELSAEVNHLKSLVESK